MRPTPRLPPERSARSYAPHAQRSDILNLAVGKDPATSRNDEKHLSVVSFPIEAPAGLITMASPRELCPAEESTHRGNESLQNNYSIDLLLGFALWFLRPCSGHSKTTP